MFEIRNVSRKFNTEYALRNVSLTINGGMNFIVGASGSGKTTLLRILSGMDKDFDGEAFYNGKSLKELSGNDKCEYYATKFGFISQNFNLIDKLTVLDNLMIPTYLGNGIDKDKVFETLKSLGIDSFAKQKVKKLSGGEKQRVAIARELLKNPEVLIADEPTAALDPKSAQATIEILRTIAKDRTVIVVTHDTSLIDENASIFELDKGELSSESIRSNTNASLSKVKTKPKLSFKGMFKAGHTNNKRNKGRCFALLLAILVSAGCLLVNFSGVIAGSSEKMFDELFETYGDSILDMVIADKFQSAADIGGNGDSNSVGQNIDGLYDAFLKDKRVEHVVFMEGVYEQKITLDGKTYKIQSSNMAPMLNKLVAGRIPNGNEFEVVLSEAFVKKTGLSNEEIIGKEISLDGNIVDNTATDVTFDPVSIKLQVVGVADTTQKTEEGGEVFSYTFEDAIFFSYNALQNMREQAGMTMDKTPFIIRATSPKDMIEIKDDLMQKGVVPLGRFQLIEGIIRLDNMSEEQSGSAYILIGILAVFAPLTVSIITGFMRKNEFAIYKINGYSGLSMFKVLSMEYSGIAVKASIFVTVIGLLYNTVLQVLMKTTFVSPELFLLAVAVIFGVSILCLIATGMVAVTTNEAKSLRTGDK